MLYMQGLSGIARLTCQRPWTWRA